MAGSPTQEFPVADGLVPHYHGYCRPDHLNKQPKPRSRPLVTSPAPDVEAVELLYHPGGSVQSFPLPGRADDLQLLPGGELLLELLVHLLGQLGEVLGLVLDEAESVLGQRVQHVQAVDLVTLQMFNARILCLLRIHI